MNKGKVYYGKMLAGYIMETDFGYEFCYYESYLQSAFPQSVSLTLPLSKDVYRSTILFPFFDGLIPEGWLLDIAVAHWKVPAKDRFELLLLTCRDAIGAVSVVPFETEEKNG